MDLGLSGKACVVTGSTGGIGLEAARLLAAEGARVVTCGRSEAPRVGEALHVVTDLREPAAPEALVEEAVAALGSLDVLVNNVGHAVQARFEEVADEEWDSMWQLNVMSYVRAIRAALPHLRASRGAIVNVSSAARARPATRMPPATVTKGGLLSRSGRPLGGGASGAAAAGGFLSVLCAGGPPPVHRHAALLGHEGGSALALAAGGRPLRG